MVRICFEGYPTTSDVILQDPGDIVTGETKRELAVLDRMYRQGILEPVPEPLHKLKIEDVEPDKVNYEVKDEDDGHND